MVMIVVDFFDVVDGVDVVILFMQIIAVVKMMIIKVIIDVNVITPKLERDYVRTLMA